jgi:transcriptional regulator with XRE-family HTH domain
MEAFDPLLLKRLRLKQGITMKALAKKLGTSTTQVHRLENGLRRLTVTMLFEFCEALNAHPSDLFEFSGNVPVTGIVDDAYEVLPLTPNSPKQVLSPRLVQDMQDVAALGWEPKNQLMPMHGHYMFYYVHDDGVPEHAWGNRCLLLLQDGRQRIGWPIRDAESFHIDNHEGRTEFNVELIWASPILAVVPPFLMNRLKSLNEVIKYSAGSKFFE